MYALLLFLSLLSYATLNELDYPSLLKNVTYKKCCKLNQSLDIINNRTVCSESIFKQTIQYIAETIENHPDDCPFGRNECLDIHHDLLVRPDCNTLHTIDSPSVFPKCCPLNHQYDLEVHKCVPVTSDKLSSEIRGLIQIGVKDCEPEVMAIVDYTDLNGLEHLENNSIGFRDMEFRSGQFCFDTNLIKNEERVLRVCQKAEDVCKLDGFDTKGIRCIKKCCPDGYMFKHGNKCVPTFDHGIDINTSKITHSSNKNFGIIIGTKKLKKYMSTETHQFRVDINGQLHVIENDIWGVYNYRDAFYCIETFQRVGKNVSQAYFLFIKKPTEDNHIKFYVSSILLTISCIFLLLTLIVYILLPEMKNLYGKSIMIYCFILLVGFTTLASSLFIKKFNNVALCASIGFIIMFSFLGAFTWLNIICFDMWMAFGSMRVINLHNKRRELRRFIFYNLYGWGVPTFFTGFAFLVYKFEFLPDYLIPKIGKKKCFFSKEINTYDHILYFLLPMTLLIVCNCVLFVKTIAYYIKVKDEIYKMNDNTNDSEKKARSFRNNREKLNMLLKLFLIMGISWLFEVITSFVSFKDYAVTMYLEYIWDTFNCLTGVFIFCIFILKQKVLMSLRNRFFPVIPTRRSSDQSSTAITSLHSQNRMRDFSQNRNKIEIMNRK